MYQCLSICVHAKTVAHTFAFRGLDSAFSRLRARSRACVCVCAPCNNGEILAMQRIGHYWNYDVIGQIKNRIVRGLIRRGRPRKRAYSGRTIVYYTIPFIHTCKWTGTFSGPETCRDVDQLSDGRDVIRKVLSLMNE